MNHTTDTVHAGSATQAPRAQPQLTRTRGIIALTLTVAVVAGGVFGLNRLLSEDAVSPATDPTSNSPAGPAVVADGPLEVSGSGVGTQAFGTGADEVLASFAARYGEPDLTVGTGALLPDRRAGRLVRGWERPALSELAVPRRLRLLLGHPVPDLRR